MATDAQDPEVKQHQEDDAVMLATAATAEAAAAAGEAAVPMDTDDAPQPLPGAVAWGASNSEASSGGMQGRAEQVAAPEAAAPAPAAPAASVPQVAAAALARPLAASPAMAPGSVQAAPAEAAAPVASAQAAQPARLPTATAGGAAGHLEQGAATAPDSTHTPPAAPAVTAVPAVAAVAAAPPAPAPPAPLPGLPWKTVHFGYSAASITRDMNFAEVAHTFHRACLCIRTFDCGTGRPKALPPFLNPATSATGAKAKAQAT